MDHSRDADEENKCHEIPMKKDFHHPYTPYAIQETFMSTVYKVLEDGKVGILESPTGTVSFDSIYSSHVVHFFNLLNSRHISLSLDQIERS